MAGPEPSYQRVPLLPITHKDSDLTVVDEEAEDGVGLKVGWRWEGRVGGLPVRALAVGLVVLLWVVSVRVSWKMSWRRGEDAAFRLIYSDNSTTAPSSSRSHASSSPKLDLANSTANLSSLFDIEGPANFTGLSQVCNSTKWVPQRWFSCDRMEGGIGNVRNEVLTCLRYAIDAGAGFVLPSLRLRGAVAFGEKDLHTGGRAGLDFYFDVDFFKTMMAQHCPQMPIADSVYAVPDFGVASFPDLINFKDVYTLATGKANDPGAPWPALLNTNATFFGPDMDKAYPGDRTSLIPVVHRFNLSYFEWPTTNDPPLFWHNFGRVLQFRPDVVELAAEVYANLVGPDEEAFFGIHLRIEKDVGEAWGAFADLCADYVRRLLDRPLNLVYLAGGDASGLPRFRAFLAQQHSPKHHRVETKLTLLSGESLARLEAMPFDQQAQVDYLVLLKSAFHAGTAASSFTANLGARRHLLTDRKDELFIHYEDDGLTYLRNAASATFMRQAMWP